MKKPVWILTQKRTKRDRKRHARLLVHGDLSDAGNAALDRIFDAEMFARCRSRVCSDAYAVVDLPSPPACDDAKRTGALERLMVSRE